MTHHGGDAVAYLTEPAAPQQAEPLKPYLIGAAFQAARVASSLSIETFVERTRIRALYIEALETGALERFAAPIYAIGFTRSYARALGLDPVWAESEMRHHVAAGTRAWRRPGLSR
ncbi:MAG: helix-turn-helix domain-containing protein [Sphingomonas sp.]|nr:helix-turn-helix domain-containing protein [Sphingomonas sp.]